MSYDAFTTLFRDPERTPARAAVYMALQPPILDFVTPRAVKVDAVATAARVSTGKASEAINWLIARGYLKVHATDRRGVRDVTLAFAVQAAAS